MDWILEQCDECKVWKPIGTKEKPNIFAFVWQIENDKKVCPACKPQPEFNPLRYSVRFMPSVKLEPGIFIHNVVV